MYNNEERVMNFKDIFAKNDTFILRIYIFKFSSDDDAFRGRATTYSGPAPNTTSVPNLKRVPSPMAVRRQPSPLRPKLKDGAMTKTISPVTSQVDVTSATPNEEEGDESDDEVCDLSPTFARTNQHLFSSRRNSFLYQSDNEDAPSLAVTSTLSRASSVSR